MSTLGLDIGEKRIGVAIADPEGLLAIPLTVIERVGEEADLEAILALANEHGVRRIVVGLPRSLDGSIGKQAERVLSFSKVLSQRTDVPVDTWDERLSTVAAERLLRDAGVKSDKRRARRDAMAAAIILQGYLDRERASFRLDL
ncbi:MAG: Holliday junction resolvase RuvX [Dehalococcoidia bacterium]|nr:MAG: Holliday junction resolvase RuvX [Dehalococcoidia bacterium]